MKGEIMHTDCSTLHQLRRFERMRTTHSRSLRSQSERRRHDDSGIGSSEMKHQRSDEISTSCSFASQCRNSRGSKA